MIAFSFSFLLPSRIQYCNRYKYKQYQILVSENTPVVDAFEDALNHDDADVAPAQQAMVRSSIGDSTASSERAAILPRLDEDRNPIRRYSKIYDADAVSSTAAASKCCVYHV